jgi:hypothetical protein
VDIIRPLQHEELFMKGFYLGAACLAASLVFSAGHAAAGIDPQCAKMRDKVGCTCALQNGGEIRPNGQWRYPGRTVEAFSACMRKAGRS